MLLLVIESNVFVFVVFMKWGRCWGYRVLRGGSWNNNPRNVRCANRNRNNPDNRNNNIGFRVLLVPPQSLSMPEFLWSMDHRTALWKIHNSCLRFGNENSRAKKRKGKGDW
jgi:hypothetical protein